MPPAVSPASPAVGNGVVYVDDGNGYTHALNGSTGVALWSYHTGGEYCTAYASPVVVNGVVYVGSSYPDFKIYAFSLKHGRE